MEVLQGGKKDDNLCDEAGCTEAHTGAFAANGVSRKLCGPHMMLALKGTPMEFNVKRGLQEAERMSKNGELDL